MSDYGEDHYTRVLMMVRRGKISLVDDSGAIQKVQLPPSGIETKDNLPRIAEYGLTSNPPEGTDAYLVNIGGDPSNGAVVGTNHQGTRPTGLKTGETMLYNGLVNVQVYLSASGLIVNAGGLPVVVNSATTVTINASGDVIMNTPMLKVSGDIIDNFGTNEDTMAGMRTKYNTHTHPVVEVQTGSSTINTNIPNNQE